MLGRLAAVEQAIASGDCDLAEAQATELVTEVNGLPSSVGVETKDALRQAATNVAQLATDPEECEPTGATGESGVQTTEPETTEPETTDETTTEEEPEEEPDEGTEEQPQPEEEQPQDESPAPEGGPGGGPGQGDGGPPSGGLGPAGGGDG
jgi:hypothetical protein